MLRAGLPPLARSLCQQAGGAAFSTVAAADWLTRFTNYEARGVPAAAGTDSDAGFDLGRMHRLLAALGDPHQRWPVVHVAGTKGKGSTAAMLTAVLTAADYRVGTYTSPHVAAFNERLAIDGTPIPDRWLDDLVARHAAVIEAAQEAEGGALTQFEVATALAFSHFAEQSVDIAVVEVGLGGVRDATNVFEPADLAAAVLTPVGGDHAAALGGGVEQIAAAKAGIMKKRRPVVLARQPDAAARAVLLSKAKELGCDIVGAPAEVQLEALGLHATPSGALRQRCQLRLTGERSREALDGGGCEVEMQLIGEHQLDNAAAAVATTAVLHEQGFTRLCLPNVAKGLAAAALPGRFQVCRFADSETQASDAGQQQAQQQQQQVQQESTQGHQEQPRSTSSPAAPVLVLDGAHTPESAAALSATLRAAYPSAPVALVVAMAEDKDHRGVCAALRKLEPAVVVFTQVGIAGGRERAAAPGQLAGAWAAAAILGGGRRKGGVRTRELIQASLPAAVDMARRELHARVSTSSDSDGEGGGPPGVVLVTGSLHAVGAALRQLDLVPA